MNRVVAFLGPLVSVAAGAGAAWLGKHFPGLHLNTAKTAGQITQGIEFAVGAFVAFALQHKWLDGWQKWQAAVGGSGAAASPTGSEAQIAYFPSGDYDPTRDLPPPPAPAALGDTASLDSQETIPAGGSALPELPQIAGDAGGLSVPEGQGKPSDG